MEQKRVSFKVAKALKEAGYPQYNTNVLDGYDILGKPTTIYSSAEKCEYIAPTYLDVWLWLWREKKVELSLNYGIKLNDVDETLYCLPLEYHCKSHTYMKYLVRDMNYDCYKCCSNGLAHKHADPEEAIIAAIEYIIDNDLIK